MFDGLRAGLQQAATFVFVFEFRETSSTSRILYSLLLKSPLSSELQSMVARGVRGKLDVDRFGHVPDRYN